MPPYHLAPSASQTQASVLRRVEVLELTLGRTKNAEAPDTIRMRPVVFSYPGTPATGTISGRYTNEFGDTFATARINATVAGGGTMTVLVLLNGSTIATLTLGSGANTALFAAAFSIGSDDYVQVEATGVSGQEEVTVELQ